MWQIDYALAQNWRVWVAHVGEVKLRFGPMQVLLLMGARLRATYGMQKTWKKVRGGASGGGGGR